MNTTTKTPLKKLRFTPTEWEIIRHRLEAPHAIYEAAFEHPLDVKDGLKFNVSADLVNKVCENLLQHEHHFNDIVGRLAEEIIKEACEGSVFMPLAQQAYENDGINKGKLMAYHCACNRLEKKLDISIPRQ